MSHINGLMVYCTKICVIPVELKKETLKQINISFAFSFRFIIFGDDGLQLITLQQPRNEQWFIRGVGNKPPPPSIYKL